MTETKNRGETSSRGRRSNFFAMLTLAILWVGSGTEAAPSEIAGRSASAREEGTLISGDSSRRSQSDEEVGNPSELAWQAWLLVDGNTNPQASGILDSASLLRRITPKSIFIAPALTACAEGYQADTMNRCVKDVSIDTQAHRDFLVERLNALFANAAKPQIPHAPSSLSSSSSSPTGPLQLNIPLLMTGASKPVRDSTKLEDTHQTPRKPEKKTSVEETPEISHHTGFKRENASQDAIVTVYELDDSLKENEGTFLTSEKTGDSENTKVSSIEVKPETPVAKNVPESVENLPLVDYNAPPDEISTSNDYSAERYEKNEEETSSELSPALVLLLSPTRLPSPQLSNEMEHVATENSSFGRIIIKVENVMENVTEHENTSISVAENQSHSLPATTTPHADNFETTSVPEIFGDSEDESTEIYDAMYDESTEFEDELLKHSEAGLTIVPTSFNPKTSPVSTITVTPMSLIDTRDNEEKESSEISSEVSVNRDFVRETTLVDFNPTKNSTLTYTTRSPPLSENKDANTKISSADSKKFEFPEALASSDNLKNEKRDSHVIEAPTSLGETSDAIIPPNEKFVKSPEADDTRVNESANKSVQLDTPANDTPLNETSAIFNTTKLDSRANETLTDANGTRDKNLSLERAEIIYPLGGTVETLEHTSADDLKTTERSDSEETMVAASTNVAGTIVSREEPEFFTRNDKRAGQPLNFVGNTATATGGASSNPIAAPMIYEKIYDYETRDRDSAPYDRHDPHFHQRDEDAPPIIRTIDEKHYRPMNYELSSSDSVNTDQFFPLAPRPDKNYVRFPNYMVRHDETMNRVRFPSDEANSISNEYKERNRRPYATRHEEHIYNGGEGSRVNRLPDTSRKESYRWLSNGGRDDRNGDVIFPRMRSRPNVVEQRSRDRAPMLLRFWTRMPLVRDPSMPYSPRASLGGQHQRRFEPSFDTSSPLATHGAPVRRADYQGVTADRQIDVAHARNKPAIGGG